MHVLVTGGTGLIGRAVLNALRSRGDSPSVLLRPQTRVADDFSFGRVSWGPPRDRIDIHALHKIDAVIHLAGEDIAAGRWTAARKQRIRDSRVRGTRLLANALAGLPILPRVLISASAIGYYGNRDGEILTEESTAGRGFLADVAREWEAAAEPVRALGIRLVQARFGVVLSPAGGALKKMLPVFRLGLGGAVGSGRQYMSWITLPDLVRAILFLVDQPGLQGPVNCAGPQAATAADFSRVLGKVLGRPAFLPAPAFALRLALGEMADELLLGGQRVVPARLQAAGFTFEDPELEPALRKLLAA